MRKVRPSVQGFSDSNGKQKYHIVYGKFTIIMDDDFLSVFTNEYNTCLEARNIPDEPTIRTKTCGESISVYIDH